MSLKKWTESIDKALSSCQKKPGKSYFPLLIDVTSSSGITYSPRYEEFTVKISHGLGKIVKIPVPKFVTILANTKTEYNFKLHTDYRAHLVFFLTQWAKSKSEKKLGFDESFSNQYPKWCKQFGGTEPIPVREQKGIIGEVYTLLNLYDKYGLDIIDSWSRDALIDFDMKTSNSVLIEVKSSTDKSDAQVSISEYNQLENFNGNPRSLLSVVKIKSSVVKGKFIHSFLEDSMNEIKKKIGGKKSKNLHIQTLEKKINQLCKEDIFSNTINKKFFTKHEIISIEYYEIVKDDAADSMAKNTILPKGVEVNKYKLDPTVLKKVTFP